MRTLTLLEHSMVCLAIIILPAIAYADPSKSPKDQTGWIGAFLSGTDDGVKVSGVVRDGPADKAGLRAGDLIIDADGKAVQSPIELTSIVRNTAVGNEIALRVRRGGEEKFMLVKVGEWPDWFNGPSQVWPGQSWLPREPQGERRWEWPPKLLMNSEAAEHLQKQVDKLRKQLDELREKLEKHLSDKNREASRI